jgi:hypothetical protein
MVPSYLLERVQRPIDPHRGEEQSRGTGKR